MLKTISTAGTVCSSLVASGCGTGLDTHVRESLARVSLQIIFILPYPAAAIRAWLGPLGKEVLPNPTSVVVAVGLVLWVGVFPHHVRKFRIESGFKISDSLFPAGSTRFLARAKPEPQIFTTFTYGHYLTWNLREYPVFVDTRETMYRHLQTRILDAYNNAEAAHAIYRDFGINAVLVPIPKTRYIPEVGGWEDVTSVLFPRDWAIVYFDRISVVVLRRTPANQKSSSKTNSEFCVPTCPQSLRPLQESKSRKRPSVSVGIGSLLGQRTRESDLPDCAGSSLPARLSRKPGIGLVGFGKTVKSDPVNVTALMELEKVYRSLEIYRALSKYPNDSNF